MLLAASLALMTISCSPLAGNSPRASAPAPPPARVRIVLVGDSTVNDRTGWGLGFKQFLTDRAECINTAAGGRSSKSFITETRWEKALALKGDYYLIQFGHNDEPGKGDRSTDPATTYVTNMTRYVDEARAIGAKPVLITSLVRRQWDKSGSGKINSSLTPYAAAVKKLAAEKNVPLVDLHARSQELCEQLGREKCDEFSPVAKGKVDGTHLQAGGGVMFARLVVAELRKAVPELKLCLRDEPDPTITNRPPKVFDVRNYGAKGNGRTLDTPAIQKALDGCFQAGGGVVRLTAGTYLSKPIFLRNGTTLQLDEGATLQATEEPADFTNPERAGAVLAFVNGVNLTGVTIAGKGRIDGAGARWWAPVKEAKKAGTPEPRRRPRLVVLSGCVDVRVEGVTLQNSPSFHLVPADCENVDIEGVTIRAPADSPNTDAIDPSASRYVTIAHCVLDVGDDNIAIKSGHLDSAHPNAAAEFITVTNCTFLHGHGMSIGSGTVGGVRSLLVRDCTFENTISGIRIKSDRTRGGLVSDCTYSNLTMTNVKIPINITAYYPRIPTNDVAQPVTDRTPVYRNIKIANVTATSPQSAGFIVGLPECVVSNVVLENVSVAAPKGLTVRNASLKFTNVKLEVANGEPVILQTNAVIEGATPAQPPPAQP
jgi:polygalacturonase